MSSGPQSRQSRRPKSGSRKPPKLIASSAMRKNAPPMTATAIRASRFSRFGKWVRPAAPSRLWPTSWAMYSASAMPFGSRRAAAPEPGPARRRCSLRSGNHLRRFACAACPSTSKSRAWKHAGAAKATAPNPKTGSPPARSAAARAKSSISRAFCPFAARAASATAAARSSAVPARNAKAKATCARERKLKINIPAGVDDGTRLRLSQEGQPGANGGPPGDLYVVLKVKAHPIFERARRQPALHRDGQHRAGGAGDASRNPDLRRRANVKVPEGTQSGTRCGCEGSACRMLNWQRPRRPVRSPGSCASRTKLSREQRKLFEQLREMLPVENEPTEKGLFDKVKDYFM